MSEDIKLCPFCNESASLLVSVDPHITSYIAYDFRVQCNNCYGEGASFEAAHNSDIREAIQDAIKAWNIRANG